MPTPDDEMMGLIMDATGTDHLTVVEAFKCDFCSLQEDGPRTWRFACRDIVLMDMGWASRGAWAACEPCRLLIEADDYAALLARSLASFFRLHPDMDLPPLWDAMRGQVRRMHGAFREGRIGPPTLVPRPEVAQTTVERHYHKDRETCPACIDYGAGALEA